MKAILSVVVTIVLTAANVQTSSTDSIVHGVRGISVSVTSQEQLHIAQKGPEQKPWYMEKRHAYARV